MEITPIAILMVGAEPSVPLDPQDTENQVHHRDLSSVLFYSVSTYMTMAVWLLIAKKPQEVGTFPTVLLFETIVSNLTGPVIFFR